MLPTPTELGHDFDDDDDEFFFSLSSECRMLVSYAFGAWYHILSAFFMAFVVLTICFCVIWALQAWGHSVYSS